MAKYIFVTGGVVSSLGKGIASASLGALLRSRGLTISLQKFDPYLNVDPGTMNPFQHGEVFVTDDGAETDLDLGHYERFTDLSLTRKNNATAGQIYDRLISRERRGDFLGGTVQVIPHVTDEIKARMKEVAEDPEVDVAIVEIGGTVGDIESLPFLEAIRQLRLELGKENTLFVHLTLVPYIQAAREAKTKPTQHSVRELREIGIQPDILLCRSDRPLPKELRDKIALFCNVAPQMVVEARDVFTIYQVPGMFHEGGLDDLVVKLLGIECGRPDLSTWEEVVRKIRFAPNEVVVAVCGKYVHLRDAYKSLTEAITHGGVGNDCRTHIEWIDSEEVEERGAAELLEGADAIIVPGGFGTRGIDGKIEAVKYARVNKKPFLGICLGMQCATMEFARNMCGLKGAASSEFDPSSPHPVIHLLPEQHETTQKGGTMRLGAYECRLKPGTLAREAYGTDVVFERHRHRYEFNNDYLELFEKHGMIVSGVHPRNQLVEIVELKDHPWFVAVQFHPELKSRPRHPHPLFRELIRHALSASRNRRPLETGS